MQKITLKINGITRQVTANEKTVLIDFLREDLRVTGQSSPATEKDNAEPV